METDSNIEIRKLLALTECPRKFYDYLFININNSVKDASNLSLIVTKVPTEIYLSNIISKHLLNSGHQYMTIM